MYSCIDELLLEGTTTMLYAVPSCLTWTRSRGISIAGTTWSGIKSRSAIEVLLLLDAERYSAVLEEPQTERLSPLQNYVYPSVAKPEIGTVGERLKIREYTTCRDWADGLVPEAPIRQATSVCISIAMTVASWT